jgi:diguanylate cyclase (GGDEF)-like protein
LSTQAARLPARLQAWPVWELPAWLSAFVTVTVVGYLAAITIAASQTHYRARDLSLFILLTGFMAASIELTRQSGEPAGHITDVHGIWLLPVALFLPPVYALAAAIPKLALTQWRTRQTVLYRRIFSAAAVGLAYGAASLTFRAALALYHATPGPGDRWLGWIAVAAAAALLRWAVNAGLVLTAVRGSDSAVSIRQLKFSREPLYNDIAELSFSLAAAVLIADNRLLIALFLPAVTLLQRSQRHAQLTAAARIDAKTGLLNALTWQREAQVELARAARTRTPLAVAMIDIDHFKQVNDTYGHLAGDEVLKLLAAAMRALLRDYDLVGRFGGEEFSVLLPHTSAGDAAQIAERLRVRLARLIIPMGDSPDRDTVQVTVSIGVATLHSARRDLDDLIAAADAALYQAKAAGRNAVRVLPDNDG